jgi:hypothetical protein
MRLRRQAASRGPCFEAFGVPVELAVEDAVLEARVVEILPPGSTPCPPSEAAASFGLRDAGAGSYEVTRGGALLMEQASLDVALEMLDSHIRLHVAAHATDWTFVHAGVVVLDGRALVLPGESFSGKSTLVKALVERGADYYSDEYAVFDLSGHVHPYPRPLQMRTAPAAEDQEIAVLGGVASTRKAEVGVVAVIRYRPGSEWRPTHLSPGHGATVLLGNALSAYLRPRESLQVLTRAVRTATVLEGDRGEAGPVAEALLETLRG